MMQVGRAQGMVALNDALMELVTKKLVEPQEAYLKAVDKAGLRGPAEAREHRHPVRAGRRDVGRR